MGGGRRRRRRRRGDEEKEEEEEEEEEISATSSGSGNDEKEERLHECERRTTEVKQATARNARTTKDSSSSSFWPHSRSSRLELHQAAKAQAHDDIKVGIDTVSDHQEWVVKNLGVRLGHLDRHFFEQSLSQCMLEVWLLFDARPEYLERRQDMLKLSPGSERVHVLDIHERLVDLLTSQHIWLLVFNQRLITHINQL